MLDPRHLATFAAICETGSFDRAAARVHVTPSAVSQRMRALSDAAGGALFARLAPAEPTALGRRLLRHAREVAALEAGLRAELGHDGGPRSVAVAMPADVLASWGTAALAAVDGFRFDVTVDDQDHAAHLLRRGEVSACAASGDPPPGCDANPLPPLRYRAVCAPGFAARHGLPGGLAAAPMLRFDAKDGLQHRWLAACGLDADPPAHRIGGVAAFRAACLNGLGWGLNPERLVADDLAAGGLVDLGPPLDVPLTWMVARSARDLLAPVTAAVRRAAR